MVGGGLGFRLGVGPRGCRDDIEHCLDGAKPAARV